eukprot:2467314-Heterocapsa_arctica.AAC.1
MAHRPALASRVQPDVVRQRSKPQRVVPSAPKPLHVTQHAAPVRLPPGGLGDCQEAVVVAVLH